MSCTWLRTRSWLCFLGLIQDRQPAIVMTLGSFQNGVTLAMRPLPRGCSNAWVGVGQLPPAGCDTCGRQGQGERLPLRHFPPPWVTAEFFLGVTGRVGYFICCDSGRCGGKKPAWLHLRAAPCSGSILPRASWMWGRRRRDLHEGRCPQGLPARSSWAHGHRQVSAWACACARVSPAGGGDERSPSDVKAGGDGEETHAGLSLSSWLRRSGRGEFQEP